MKAETLKKSILQYAMEGKLVPQNPNDEPASELLKRIKAEKEQLIKDGKLKKEKPHPPITDGEKPFKLPKDWEWVRFAECIDVRDGTHDSPKYIAQGYPFVTSKNLVNGNLDFSNVKYISKEDFLNFSQRSYVDDGDILFAMIGSIGNPVIVKKDREFSIKNVALFKKSNYIYTKWLYYYLLYIQEYLRSNASGAVQSFVSLSLLRNYLFALPPREEQKRIVEKLEEILPLVDEYGKNEELLSEMNSKLPKQIRQSILQYAVQGKLVEQNPNDEPACELLKRIKAEKEQLIKDSKIKKEKPLSPITDEEKPFELPQGWEWVRVNDIGLYKKGPFGSALTKKIFVPKSKDTVKVYEQKNAIQKNASLGEYYITKEYYEKAMKGFTVLSGDIIVSCAGTIGETYIMPLDINLGIINQALMRMRITKNINIQYFLLYFDIILKQNSINQSKGSAIKNIPPFEIFKKMLIPLPPLEEQKRIVAKVDEIMKIVDKLERNE